jgi:hypothetical protein
MKARSFDIFTSLKIDQSYRESFSVTGTIEYLSPANMSFQMAMPTTGTTGDVSLFVTNTSPDLLTPNITAQVSISKLSNDPTEFHVVFITAK